ncbi:cytochrome c oxidase assembly factor 6 homolog isoform X1 [Dermacentor variabilis]|uniref:cytochrome c oxidase assembly factor 6 homolog isoform X1 n=1 Tax=Dermacentor variabilis TaxID=34621 RepID=UPI003F5B82DA
MSFPNKEQRQKCWDSRDRYWECLDKNAENANRCTEMKSQYETHCPSQWVKHFNRKREYLQFKDKIENEGSNLASMFKNELDQAQLFTIQISLLPFKSTAFKSARSSESTRRKGELLGSQPSYS